MYNEWYRIYWISILIIYYYSLSTDIILVDKKQQ